MAMLPVIETNELVKNYSAFQFGPLNISLAPGYVYGIVGPNGAGKTTLLKLLMNLLPPSSGTVKVFGEFYAFREKAIKQRIGFVPEEPFLYRNMNAHWFGQFTQAHFPTWSSGKYDELLRKFGVDQTKPTKLLSKGNRVKLQLALALAHTPDLLILDEPTSGLDPLVRQDILSEIAGVVRDENTSVIFSTHITEDVERIADYVLFIINGNLSLMEQRDVLREQWQEWVMDASDVKQLPGLLYIRDTGQPVVRVVVSQASSAMQYLKDKGANPLNRRSLGLEEILAELVRSSSCRNEVAATRVI
jgi:ABC-2 type transport system ATP-binding protein